MYSLIITYLCTHAELAVQSTHAIYYQHTQLNILIHKRTQWCVLYILSMRSLYKFSLLLMLLSWSTLIAVAQGGNKAGRFTISFVVTDAETKEGLVMANCFVQPLGASAVTDGKGYAVVRNVPAGSFNMTVAYVGYEPYRTQVQVSKDLTLQVRLTPRSLKFGEAVVTAKRNVAGTATSSHIGRTAIDHLQATSLADVMQLIPGQLMGNTDPTQQSNLQLRTLSNNKTAAIGGSIVIDGVPMSNNGAMTQGGFSASSFAGTDLRQISADNIESVEVVRGIPSAEYGDLTSGLVVVNSRSGVTPWQIRGKITPAILNTSVSKGFLWGNSGVWNVNLDYAKAWGDPRQKTRSFNRYTFSLGWGKDISRRWHTETRLRLMQAEDWSGNDPDAKDDGTSQKSTSRIFSLSHNGRISVNRLLARTVNYTLGLSLSPSDAQTTTFVGVSSGLLPLLTARETGYYAVPWKTSSYLASGKTENRPGNFFAKIDDAFFFRTGRVHQAFKIGMEYKLDWNSGRGYYNVNDSFPLRPNSNGRPRAFSDIPALHQLSAFAEDRLTWNIDRLRTLRLQAGLRFSSQQPFSDLATVAVSPRINAALSLNKAIDLRAGFGLSSKTPGLDFLYPDKHYNDHVSVNYMPQNDPAAQLLVYYTDVYHVQRSLGLKNATTTKFEAGIDINLPQGRKFSLLAYHDRTPNGFANLTDYRTYTVNTYTPSQGLIINAGQPTAIDPTNPAYSTLYFGTTGRIGNTNTLINRGIEFDFDLGTIQALRTQIFFSGAYSESKSYSTDLETATPVGLSTAYTAVNTTPIKMVYPASTDYSRYRRFLNTLRLVTSIPVLRMVASFTGQVVWHDYNLSFQGEKTPIGYIDNTLQFHALSADQLSGFLGANGQYYATAPTGIESISVARQVLKAGTNIPTKLPVTWNMSFRLTKEFGNFAGLSLYVNNSLFYEPFLASSNSQTLSQRNTGNFSFGAELFIKL